MTRGVRGRLLVGVALIAVSRADNVANGTMSARVAPGFIEIIVAL